MADYQADEGMEAQLEVAEDEHPKKNEENKDNADLIHFRRQWKEEIGARQSKQKSEEKTVNNTPTSVQLKAKEIYLKGVAAERAGDSYVAMLLYRQATKLVPDIEWHYDFSNVGIQTEAAEASRKIVSEEVDEKNTEKNKSTVLENLSLRALCEPEVPTKKTHISALTNDVMLTILCWIVSSNLHLHCLEQFSLVCKGFYLLARDQIIWQKACKRLWKDLYPVEYDGSWRILYLKTPHVHFHGCYISKTSYIRPGEPSLDSFYRPFHVVTYYRFLRFFPNGSVLYMNSPEDPAVCVGKLAHYHKGSDNVLNGQYRVVGDRVVVGLVSYRFQSVKGGPGGGGVWKKGKLEVSHEDKFQMELMLKGKKWQQLTWAHYSVTQLYRSTGKVTETNFDIDNSMTSLYFSPVKSYFISDVFGDPL